MTGLKTTGEKKLMLFTGRAYPELAQEVADELGVEIAPTKAHDFANGEIYTRFEESVRGSDAFVIQCHSAPINHSIMEQLIMVDALKRASAKRITVDHPVLRLRPAGQEAQGPRAHLGPADGRLLRHRRRRPADGGGPAHRPDPGLLRRPGGPPVRAAAAGGLHQGQVRHLEADRRLPGRRPGAHRRPLDRPAEHAAGHRAQAPRPEHPEHGLGRTRSSARSRAGSACWSTTWSTPPAPSAPPPRRCSRTARPR